MEIATLIVELIKALAWPITFVSGVILFRLEIRLVLKRLLGAPEIELEYKGIKLKLKALETLVQQAEASHLEPSLIQTSKAEHTQESLLSTVAALEPEDVEFLVQLRIPSPGCIYNYLYGEKDIARANRLCKMGLLTSGQHSDGFFVDLTLEGHKIALAAYNPSTRYGL
jgi:hypothetical protein